ncbi:curlin [Shewanella sp. FJAT-53749]|uniref:curlin n=1 Tax=Shewanella psychrotolerans TaxID=2864206 RepID=UPI001C65F685|nr:curlin [Shewanella psychrotolerans]
MGVIVALSIFSAPNQAEELIDGANGLPITLQTLLEGSGRENVINLFQLGTLNHANLSQSGAGNGTSLIQMGSSNHAEIIQYGEDNEVELLQAGINNFADITQVGNDNLVQINQLGSASFSIEQIADGAAITITQY